MKYIYQIHYLILSLMISKCHYDVMLTLVCWDVQCLNIWTFCSPIKSFIVLSFSYWQNPESGWWYFILFLKIYLAPELSLYSIDWIVAILPLVLAITEICLLTFFFFLPAALTSMLFLVIFHLKTTLTRTRIVVILSCLNLTLCNNWRYHEYNTWEL